MKAVVNNSRMAQSFVGCVSKASYVQFAVGKLVIGGKAKMFVSNCPQLTITFPLPAQFVHVWRLMKGLMDAQVWLVGGGIFVGLFKSATGDFK